MIFSFGGVIFALNPMDLKFRKFSTDHTVKLEFSCILDLSLLLCLFWVALTEGICSKSLQRNSLCSRCSSDPHVFVLRHVQPNL